MAIRSSLRLGRGSTKLASLASASRLRGAQAARLIEENRPRSFWNGDDWWFMVSTFFLCCLTVVLSMFYLILKVSSFLIGQSCSLSITWYTSFYYFKLHGILNVLSFLDQCQPAKNSSPKAPSPRSLHFENSSRPSFRPSLVVPSCYSQKSFFMAVSHNQKTKELGAISEMNSYGRYKL